MRCARPNAISPTRPRWPTGTWSATGPPTRRRRTRARHRGAHLKGPRWAKPRGRLREAPRSALRFVSHPRPLPSIPPRSTPSPDHLTFSATESSGRGGTERRPHVRQRRRGPCARRLRGTPGDGTRHRRPCPGRTCACALGRGCVADAARSRSPAGDTFRLLDLLTAVHDEDRTARKQLGCRPVRTIGDPQRRPWRRRPLKRREACPLGQAPAAARASGACTRSHERAISSRVANQTPSNPLA
jgi:hypothetical protein